MLLVLAACDADGVPPPTCDDATIEHVATWAEADLPARADIAHTEPGVALGDLDGDGDLDAFVAWGGGSFVLANDGAGTLALDEGFNADGEPFVEAAAVALADLDGDGDLDAWLGRERGDPAVILTNDGTGAFTSAAVPESETAAATGAFGDADGDGDLDLVVANLLRDVDPQLVLAGEQAGVGNRLWLQEDGVWTPTPLPDAQAEALTFQAAWLDVESDGDLDLYLGNVWGQELTPNQLFRNEGDATFVEDAACACDRAMNSMGVAVGDADGDGSPDLYVTDVGTGLLFLNDGAGLFADATHASGAYLPPSETNLSGWGATFTDLDLDGCEDLFVTYGRLASDGAAELDAYQPEGESWSDPEMQADVWLRGDCEGGFARAEGTDLDTVLVRDRGVSVGDLDGDLRPDLVTVGKFTVNQWRTIGGCGPGVRLRLAGPSGNANGFGAKIEVEVGDRVATRWMLPSSTHSQNALELLLGLGGADAADVVRVTWPDGAVTEHAGVAAGATLVASP
ncbi:MAG: CRTAC1 family protein [Myxococcota bacterium]